MAAEASSYRVPAGRVTVRQYPQGIVGFVFEKGMAFELDEIGCSILVLLEKPNSVSSLVSALGQNYSEEPGKIVQDVSAFLDECVKLGLVDVIT